MSTDEEYITAYLENVLARGIIPESVRRYRSDLERFLNHPAVREAGSLLCVTEQTVHRYRRDELEGRGYAGPTVYHKTRVLYELYQWLVEEGVLLHNPVPRARQRARATLPRRAPSQKTVRRLLRTLNDSPNLHDRRNSVLIDLAYSCGLRRCELIRLDIHDVNLGDGTIHVRGKHGTQRLVPVGRRTVHALQHYLYNVRPLFLRDGTTDALFVSWINGGRRIGTATITRIFLRLRRRGHPDRPVTSHALRRAFATHLLQNGAPVQDVSRMLGHACLETTQIYTRLVPTDLKDHHRRFHPRGG